MQAKAMQSPATPTSAKLALWICFWFAVVTCAVSYINHMISMAVDQFWLQRSPLTILTFPLRGLTMCVLVWGQRQWLIRGDAGTTWASGLLGE